MATASPYGRGLIGLLKRCWHDIPGVMGTSVLGIVGIAFGIAAVRNYNNHGVRMHQYKLDYVVVRPDDPRAQKVLQNKS